MEESIVPQIIVNGLASGLIYILMALGFSLIFSILNIFNFAHGEFYMVGAFTVYLVVERAGLPYPTGVLLAIAGTGLLGVVVERFLFRPLRDQMFASFIVALGVVMALSTIAAILFGTQIKYLAEPISGAVSILGATITWQKLSVILISAVLVAGLYIVVHRTKFGRTIRATAANPEAASLAGVRINPLCTQTFGIATALAGAAGALMAPIFFIGPYIGTGVIFRVMVVVILGGLGSIPGAIAGGLVLGFIESVGLTYLGGIANALGWFAVIVLLLFRPQGLLGRR